MKRLIIILAKIGKIISKILIYINALFTSICCISSTFLIMGLICTLFFYLVSLFSGRDTSDLDVLSVLIMIIFLLCISIISFFLGIGLYTINEKLDNILINKSLEGKTSEKD